MVKIKDLTDPQLDSQIKKYSKILKQLEEEKNKRLEATGASTQKEEEAFSVSFDDDEIQSMQESVAKEKVKDEEEEEQVRVTQLLQLSKDQLQELQNNSKKIKAQESKSTKKKVRK